MIAAIYPSTLYSLSFAFDGNYRVQKLICRRYSCSTSCIWLLGRLLKQLYLGLWSCLWVCWGNTRLSYTPCCFLFDYPFNLSNLSIFFPFFPFMNKVRCKPFSKASFLYVCHRWLFYKRLCLNFKITNTY